MSQQISPELQQALRDEIDSMRMLVAMHPGNHCAFIAVIADNFGNLHFQFTGTKDPVAAPNLAIGINYAAAEFLKGMDYGD